MHRELGEWVRLWRSPDGSVEAMHAHFRAHVYHRHSHETYSFGVTDAGAQSFTCRGSSHTSVAGMVMAFNPDDPHDGRAGDRVGFTYRMVHVSPEVVAGVLADATGRPARLPLFSEPVVDEPALTAALRHLHTELARGTALARDEALATALLNLARLARTGPRPPLAPPRGAARLAARVRTLLHNADGGDLSAGELAGVAGCGRYAVTRAFQATYGLAPSEYQRLLRLRRARRLLAGGMRPVEAAAAAGFADQAHLTRWFVRCFGVTPGAYAALC